MRSPRIGLVEVTDHPFCVAIRCTEPRVARRIKHDDGWSYTQQRHSELSQQHHRALHAGIKAGSELAQRLGLRLRVDY